MAKSSDGNYMPRINVYVTHSHNIYSFTVCDRNYNATQGRLVSKESRACEAYINAPENHTISLYFTAFNYYLNEVSCAEVNTPIEAS